jgi:hypothetical protein
LLFSIIDIDNNDDVTLAPITNTGEVEADKEKHVLVEFANFDTVYRVTTKAVEMHPAWPTGSPKTNVDFYNAGREGIVMAALQLLGVSHHHEYMRVQDQPSRAVFSGADMSFNMGECTIPPCTTNITLVTKADKEPNTIRIVCTIGTDEPRFALTHSSNKKCCPPFWYMRKVNDKQHANFEIVDVNVDSTIKLKGGAKRGSTTVVSVPCAVNFREVAGGQELVLYMPAVTKEKDVKTRKHKLVLDSENERKVAKNV